MSPEYEKLLKRAQPVLEAALGVSNTGVELESLTPEELSEALVHLQRAAGLVEGALCRRRVASTSSLNELQLPREYDTPPVATHERWGIME